MNDEQTPSPEDTGTEAEAPAGPSLDFPVVALGGSAGALNALETFFARMPPNSGMAFVVVTHQLPDHKSLLPELIGRHTSMPVAAAEEGQAIEPDHVYVMPPGEYLAVHKGKFHLMKPAGSRSPRMPIDYFFRSLAQDLTTHAVGVVLSGTGSDGSQGVREIKGLAGLTMAQEPESAAYGDMPRHAIETGDVDFIAAVDDMPDRLQDRRPRPEPAASKPVSSAWEKMFMLLRMETGHDFSDYKLSTIQRRVARRMNVVGLDGLDRYLRYLQENRLEIDLLFHELLIGVTSFFRNPEAFEHLKNGPLADYIQSAGGNREFRVWVPGCSTGEEAYSIAILLHELRETMGLPHEMQIFGTDIDGVAIEAARSGIYPEGIVNDVSPERLEKYFVHEAGRYRIAKEIRNTVVFAAHDVVKDPPFIRIDLVSCRNLLIYLNPSLQGSVLTRFHYALRKDGILFLGASETTGRSDDWFRILDRHWKIWAKKDEIPARLPLARFPTPNRREPSGPADVGVISLGQRRVADSVLRLLTERYVPVSVLVNQRGEIVYIHGQTGAYLEPSPGYARLNLVEMARPGLKIELSSAMRKALLQDKAVVFHGVRIRGDVETKEVDVHVERISAPEELRDLLLVTFHPRPASAKPAAESFSKADGSRDEILEQELAWARDSLQATVEELETSNEELKASNEELQSTNEELQSTNEELETSREETQSLNEELNTVNAELEAKVDDLERANVEIQNLLNMTHFATIFLDRSFNILRFTDKATEYLNVRDNDIGRPLGELATNLDADNVEDDIRSVLDTLIPIDREVRTVDGAWLLMRVTPYRSTDDAIKGVVLSFVNIDPIKRAQIAGEKAAVYSDGIVQTVREPLVVLDAALRVVSANRAFYRAFRITPRQSETESFFDLAGGRWDVPRLRNLLELVKKSAAPFEDFEVEATFPKIGKRRILLNARRIQGGADQEPYILIAIEDVTVKDSVSPGERP